MLTNDQILENKEKFFKLLSTLDFDMAKLAKYLDYIDYFTKPATIQYNGAYSGGLCEYSLKLCHELGVLCNAYFPGRYSEEDAIKVALFKDMYKAEMYVKCLKNVKNDESGQWESVESYKIKEGHDRPTFGSTGFSSFMIAKNFLTFSDEQIEAICNSCQNSSCIPDIYEIYKSFPLVSLTRMADMVVSYLGDN